MNKKQYEILQSRAMDEVVWLKDSKNLNLIPAINLIEDLLEALEEEHEKAWKYDSLSK